MKNGQEALLQYGQLASAMRDVGAGWVVDEVEEVIARGKTVAFRDLPEEEQARYAALLTAESRKGLSVGKAKAGDQPAPPPPQQPSQQQPQAKVRIEPMSAMRKAIAEHMVASKHTSAHVTTIHKVDMTRVEKMRQKHKADFQARYGLSLTYLPFITRATVEGLRAYPLLNASIDGVYSNHSKSVSTPASLNQPLRIPISKAA